MNEPDLLLIDVNGLGYAAMYQPNLAKLEHQGFSTAALHGALMSVFETCRRQSLSAVDHVSRTLRWFGNRLLPPPLLFGQ